MSESKTAKENEGHIEDCKVGAGDWLAQNFELGKDFILANYQDSPDSGVHASSTHESEKDDFDHGAPQ